MKEKKSAADWWDDPVALQWWDALDSNWRVLLKACFLKQGPLEAEPLSEAHKRELVRVAVGVDCLRLHLPDVHSLEPVRRLLNLQQLHCAHTKVQDLAPLQSLPCLEEVNLTGSCITSLDSLRHCNRLKRLWCYRTSISSLEPLYGLATLERLGVSATLAASEIRQFQRHQPACQVYVGV
jgi:hypothetical protein